MASTDGMGFTGALLLGLAVLVASAPAGKAWAEWRYSRSIELPSTDSVRLVSVILPQDVYLHVQVSLADLRIIDDHSREIPYVRYTREGSTTSKGLSTEILENSFVRGLYTQMVLSVGASPPVHTSVAIRTGQSDFLEWVSVEASDDHEQWRMVAERAPIFRFRQQNRQGTQTVHYSPNHSRYLRIRVLDTEKSFPIDSAQVFSDTVELPERSYLDENPVEDPTARAAENSWNVDLGTPALGVGEVRFAVNPAEFDRTVGIQVSGDGSRWRQVASGEIYRFRREATADERLHIDVPGEVTGRHWRITVVNGSDPPLPGVVPSLYITPVHLVFEQQPGVSYRLIYGHSGALVPQYDLAKPITADEQDSAVAGQLGEEQETASFAGARGWSRRYRSLLWISAALAALLLGFFALRLARTNAVC